MYFLIELLLVLCNYAIYLNYFFAALVEADGLRPMIAYHYPHYALHIVCPVSICDCYGYMGTFQT